MQDARICELEGAFTDKESQKRIKNFKNDLDDDDIALDPAVQEFKSEVSLTLLNFNLNECLTIVDFPLGRDS